MRMTATGLAAAALLGLAGSIAHADPFFGCPPQACVPRNPFFYTAGSCGCWYGPNYCFQGPCLPGQPFNGMLPVPKEYEQGHAPAYASGRGGYPPGMQPPGGYPQGMPPLGGLPGRPGMPPGLQPLPGMAGYAPPPLPGPAVFPTHPFARSPRDFFMYGQQYND